MVTRGKHRTRGDQALVTWDCINLTSYANALRCSWYKRLSNSNGLWSNILQGKIANKENACFIRPRDIHPLHISILPIVKAFEELVNKVGEIGGGTVKMNMPLDQLPLLKKPPSRAGKILLTKPTKATHSFLFQNGKICELTGSMITTPESTFTASPTLRSNEELCEILNISDLNFISRGSIILKF